jgi:hypothetical protein
MLDRQELAKAPQKWQLSRRIETIAPGWQMEGSVLVFDAPSCPLEGSVESILQ